MYYAILSVSIIISGSTQETAGHVARYRCRCVLCRPAGRWLEFVAIFLSWVVAGGLQVLFGAMAAFAAGSGAVDARRRINLRNMCGTCAESGDTTELCW